MSIFKTSSIVLAAGALGTYITAKEIDPIIEDIQLCICRNGHLSMEEKSRLEIALDNIHTGLLGAMSMGVIFAWYMCRLDEIHGETINDLLKLID